jgi:hypothetical protein
LEFLHASVHFKRLLCDFGDRMVLESVQDHVAGSGKKQAWTGATGDFAYVSRQGAAINYSFVDFLPVAREKVPPR